MRLICPRCGAQYEIDAAAVPPTGRDVECSACDHVWRAMPEAESFDPGARPQLSRPLSESVIEILREEAARELEVRASERRTQRAAERAAAVIAGIEEQGSGEPATLPGSADAETREKGLPASGVVSNGSEPAGQHTRGAANVSDDDALPAAQELEPARGGDLDRMTAGVAGVSGVETAVRNGAASRSKDRDTRRDNAQESGLPLESQVPRPDPRNTPATGSTVIDAPGNPVRPLPSSVESPSVTEAVPPPRASFSRQGYAAGFGAAVMIALVAVALYMMAPGMADQGPLGATLAEWRGEVERGRAWLSLQGEAVTGSLRGLWGGE